MYTNPRTHEQILHNALILVKALHTINMDLDIKVGDFIVFYFDFCMVVLDIQLRWDCSETVLFQDVLLYDGNQNTASYE